MILWAGSTVVAQFATILNELKPLCRERCAADAASLKSAHSAFAI
jgi:hypothetical protein